jgi:translation initiation factor 2 gamma subunit (eIF-2gamma)
MTDDEYYDFSLKNIKKGFKNLFKKTCVNCKKQKDCEYEKVSETEFICEDCDKFVGDLLRKKISILDKCYHHTPFLGMLTGGLGKGLIDGGIIAKRMKKHSNELLKLDKKIEEINKKRGIVLEK